MILQTSGAQETLSSFPKKGSYLYYGQPAFEDNSFLLEEAFNQPMGVIQHIFNVSLEKFQQGNVAYSFTQEIPLTELTHQLSYTLNYNVMRNSQENGSTAGFGDLYVSYSRMIWGEKDWIMAIPRFTLILPTGSAQEGLGSGGWGGQFNLAVTKRLSGKIVTHYNAGLTSISKAKRYETDTSTNKTEIMKKDLHHRNLGASIIWYPARKFNLLLEYVSNFVSSMENDDASPRSHHLTLNPGFRFCIDNGHIQIVPGISVPIDFRDGKYDHTGVFLYLSFEPDYLIFYKAKGQ